MNSIIIEDEQIAAQNLALILNELDPSFIVQARLESVRDAVTWLNDNKTDLIFLDIHLSDGLSFRIFEQIQIKTPIIFTTAYDQYAIKAFKLNSIDYLLKPIDKQELAHSLNKFKELQNHSGNSIIDYKSILELLTKKPEYQKRFMVYAGQKIKSIEVQDIAYFYVLEKNIFLCTQDNKRYDIDNTLEQLESLLDPEQFFRINRQFIISFKSISGIFPLSKSRIKLELHPKNDEEAIVSFNRSAEFKKWLNR